MTIEEVRVAPRLLDREITDGVGNQYRLRLLRSSDHVPFGDYLEGLSPETRVLFGPHPLTADAARTICSALDPIHALRFVLWNHEEQIVGYFIVYPGVRHGEIERYAKAGVELTDRTDCTFAPSLADTLQSKGVGTTVFHALADIVRSLGFSRMVLSGGTQEQNARGRAYYEKNGFREICTFDTQPAGRGVIHNIDMMLDLLQS